MVGEVRCCEGIEVVLEKENELQACFSFLLRCCAGRFEDRRKCNLIEGWASEILHELRVYRQVQLRINIRGLIYMDFGPFGAMVMKTRAVAGLKIAACFADIPHALSLFGSLSPPYEINESLIILSCIMQFQGNFVCDSISQCCAARERSILNHNLPTSSESGLQTTHCHAVLFFCNEYLPRLPRKPNQIVLVIRSVCAKLHYRTSITRRGKGGGYARR